MKMSEEKQSLNNDYFNDYFNDSDTDSGTDSESDVNDYGGSVKGSDKAEIDSLFGDISDLNSDLEELEEQTIPLQLKPVIKIRSVKERQQNKREIDQDKYDIPNFSSLETEETYLPFSHVLSMYQEWKCVEDACLSGFRDVSELSKVRNKTISLVADAAEYALQQNKALLPDLNKSFVVYAAQRGV